METKSILNDYKEQNMKLTSEQELCIREMIEKLSKLPSFFSYEKDYPWARAATVGRTIRSLQLLENGQRQHHYMGKPLGITNISCPDEFKRELDFRLWEGKNNLEAYKKQNPESTFAENVNFKP